MTVRALGELADASGIPLGSIDVQLVPRDIITHWPRCGATADWAAHMLAYNFDQRETAASVLSTVINELLENAVKFSANNHHAIRLRVAQRGDRIVIETENVTEPMQSRVFEAHLAALFADRGELFSQLVARAAAGETGAPGVGLLVMRRDFGATLGVELSPLAGGDDLVRVRVALAAGALEHR